jgi:hypothetical protein
VKPSITSQQIGQWILAGLLIFLFTKSPLLQGAKGQFHIDSEVYMHVASECIKGKVLYKDVFDHKGPILYLFDIIGLGISGHNPIGIWVVQMLFLVFSFSSMMKQIFRSICWTGAMASGLYFIAWIYRYLHIGDNTPELFAVGFLSLQLAILLQQVHSDTLNFKHGLLFGFSAVGLLLMKINFGVLWLPMLFMLLMSLGSLQERVKMMGWIVLGGLILVAPFLAYLVYFQAVPYCIDAIWTFNFNYMASNKLNALESVFEIIGGKRNYFLWFIFFILIGKLVFTAHSKKLGYLVLVTFTLALLVLVALPGRGNDSKHYILPLAPFVAVLLFWMLYKLKDFIGTIFLFISLYFTYPMMLDIWHQNPKVSSPSAEMKLLTQYASANSSLFVLGNYSKVYRLTGMTSPSRFFYTYPILSDCKSKWTESCLAELSAQKPDLIYVQQQMKHPSCWLELLSSYRLIYSSSQSSVYKKKTD